MPIYGERVGQYTGRKHRNGEEGGISLPTGRLVLGTSLTCHKQVKLTPNRALVSHFCDPRSKSIVRGQRQSTNLIFNSAFVGDYFQWVFVSVQTCKHIICTSKGACL